MAPKYNDPEVEKSGGMDGHRLEDVEPPPMGAAEVRGTGGPEGRRSADLGLLSMALIWGVNFPVIKGSLSSIPPLAFNALRFPLACLTVLLILRARGGILWPRRADWPRVVVLGLLGNVLYQFFFIFGLNGTYAGNASILLATIPIWTTILSTARGHERPGTQVWSGILITLVGMVLVILGGEAQIGFHGSTLKGDLLMVGAAVAWSIYTVGSRGLIHRYGSLPVTSWTLWIGSPWLVLLGLAPLSRAEPGSIPITAWLGVLYAGVFAIGLAYVLWYRGVQQIGSSRTAAYQNLVPVVALAVAWLWLGEIPQPIQLLGAAVVLCGVSLARLGRERKG